MYSTLHPKTCIYFYFLLLNSTCIGPGSAHFLVKKKKKKTIMGGSNMNQHGALTRDRTVIRPKRTWW